MFATILEHPEGVLHDAISGRMGEEECKVNKDVANFASPANVTESIDTNTTLNQSMNENGPLAGHDSNTILGRVGLLEQECSQYKTLLLSSPKDFKSQHPPGSILGRLDVLEQSMVEIKTAQKLQAQNGGKDAPKHDFDDPMTVDPDKFNEPQACCAIQ